jgi:hypothetical protein
MLDAQRHHDADIVRGRTVYTYPEPLPRWILKPNKMKRRPSAAVQPAKPLHVRTS